MKKSKVLLVAILCVVLCILSVSSTTFSWFVRPQDYTGGKLSWSVGSSDGVTGNTVSGVTATTYLGSEEDGVVTYPDQTTVSGSGFTNSSGLGAGSSIYYHTVISNPSAKDQNVSLYFPQINFNTSNTTFCLGVNGPTRTHKYYGPNVPGFDTSSNKEEFTDYFRIYMQLKTDCTTNWPIEDNYEVKYGVDGLTDTKNMTKLSDYDGHGLYYVDIPVNTKHVQFQRRNTSISYYQSQEFTDIIGDGQSTSNSLLFYNTNDYTGGYNNCHFRKTTFAAGIGFMNYYKQIYLCVGDTFDASLSGGTDYHKSSSGTLTYYADSSHLAIMKMTGDDPGSNTTGQIQALAAGSSKLYTKIEGQCGDAMQMETTVTVLRSSDSLNTVEDVPIVTNVKVPAAVSGVSGTVDVYWYITNDSSNGGMKYTISDLYLTQ